MRGFGIDPGGIKPIEPVRIAIALGGRIVERGKLHSDAVGTRLDLQWADARRAAFLPPMRMSVITTGG